MIIRLRNLTARAPRAADLDSIAALIAVCEGMETGRRDMHGQDLRQQWLAPGFSLQQDAWVIVNRRIHIVAYASIHLQEEALFKLQLFVHPEYRGRGIGTLLIWLAEERARQLTRDIHSDLRVCISTTVYSGNQAAIRLFEREGYKAERNFWRLIVEMDHTLVQSFDELRQGNKIKLDVVVDAQQVDSPSPDTENSAVYSAHQYTVYEKQLRAGCIILEDLRASDLLACQ